MSLIGAVSLTNKRGMYLGEVRIDNLNLNANEIAYSSTGESIDGSPNLQFDGNSKLHLGGSLLFTNTYDTNFEGVTDSNQSTQNLLLQNKNSGTTASTNIYLTNSSTLNQASDYCVIGMNGGSYSGVNYVSEAPDSMYISNTNKDLSIVVNPIGSGAGIHLSGNGGVSGISVNPNNAISLGTTYNAGTDTYTYNCGAPGQVLTSAGTAAIPTWTTPAPGITVSNQADNRLISATSVADSLNGEANLTFDGTILKANTVNFHTASGGPGLGERIQINDIAAAVGNQNVAIGHQCRAQSSSVSIGFDIGRTGMNGTYNVLIGRSTGIGLTSGGGDIVIGGNAAQQLTTGNNNTIVGVSSGANQTTQSNNTIFGYTSNCRDTLGVTRSNCGIFGDNIGSVLSGDNEIQIGKSTTTVYTYATATRSDGRDKTDIRETELGLNFINALKPKQYRWNYRDDYRITDENGNVVDLPNDGTHKRTRFHNGFIAQDIQQTMTEMGIDFAGLQHGEVGGGTDVYHLNYSELIAPLVKAVQELSEKVNSLTKPVGE